MAQIIIYPNDDDSLSIIVPVASCELPIEEIALKDVPPGKPYHIIDSELLPKEDIFADALEADFSSPSGLGADYGTGSENTVIGWDENNKPVIKEASE
jgi:hypothetical protein